MKTRICVAALLALSIAVPAVAQQTSRAGAPSGDQFKAVTTNNRPSGEKALGGITWSCYKLDCKAIYGARPEVANTVLSCQLLAQWTGGLVSYGRTGAKFTAAQMAQCNTPPPPPPPPTVVPGAKLPPGAVRPQVTVPLKPPG